MNFIAATVVLKSSSQEPVTAYGLSYRSAEAAVPGGNGNSEVRLRLLCYDRAGAKLDAFNEWKEGNSHPFKDKPSTNSTRGVIILMYYLEVSQSHWYNNFAQYLISNCYTNWLSFQIKTEN